MIPVILAGGGGRRLWPLSRPRSPKQFLRLAASDSLLQATARRALSLTDCNPSKVVSVTNQFISDKTARHLKRVHPDLPNGILIEPASRNTGAAISFVATSADPDDLLWIMPADHDIGDSQPLRESLLTAKRAAQQDHIVVIGIPPRHPSSQLGYIKSGKELPFSGAFEVCHFAEKPNAALAREYIDSGAYYWNAGMVIAKAGVICEALSKHAPEYLNPYDYSSLDKRPFDKLVLEKTHNAAVVPCTARWRDVGSWNTLLATFVDNITRAH